MLTSKPTTFDEYLADFMPEVQVLLQQVREIIQKAAPEAQEAIKYGMPTFIYKGNLVYFAAFKNHIGLYALPTGNQAFAEELAGYKTGKGSIQFPLHTPMPLDLISRIVKFRVVENDRKAAAKKKAGLDNSASYRDIACIGCIHEPTQPYVVCRSTKIFSASNQKLAPCLSFSSVLLLLKDSMRNKKIQIFRKYLLAGLLLSIHSVALAQAPFGAGTTASGGPFALHTGDRVVFVGNSLFENDLLYGYLELALTTRWPDRQVTFRNIGWTGDTVWGEARSYFTNPPTPYELLLKQITEARPTVVFVAYGGIEAQKGQEGLPDFVKGLDRLLDTLSRLGARTVLLSPPPLFLPEHTDRNATLAEYTNEIARRAAARGTLYIDIFNPLKELAKNVVLSDNGFHLNESGYYQLANVLDKQLGGASRAEAVAINVSKKQEATSQTAKILPSPSNGSILQFELDNTSLPLPLPDNRTSQPVNTQLLRITGLKKGAYTLTTNGFEVVSASADQWAKGVAILQGPDFTEAERLRELIVEKNQVFFHQYRPQNRTYILGFRSYEQGRHAKGLEDLGLIITWLEGQIAQHRMPTSSVYQLTQLR